MYSGNMIRVVGTIDENVITRLMGKISLVDGKIYRLDKFGETTTKCGIVCDRLNKFREILLNRIRINVPEPESGLVAGIVLGYKNDIGREFNQEMINSGTIHIAVASGYNVMLVGGMTLSLLFWFLKRKGATVVAILVMVFYTIIAGGEPPVIRAVIMAGLIYVANAIGRGSSSLWVLCLATWTMMIWNPYIITSVSFQLSVAASVGMIVVDPWLSSCLKRVVGEKMLEFLTGLGIVTSLATMVMTAPIIGWHFGRMSWIGILSNILILPVVPLLMSLAGLMLIFGSWITVPVYALAHFMVVVIGFLGG